MPVTPLSLERIKSAPRDPNVTRTTSSILPMEGGGREGGMDERVEAAEKDHHGWGDSSRGVGKCDAVRL